MYLGLGHNNATTQKMNEYHALILNKLGSKYGLNEHLAKTTKSKMIFGAMEDRYQRRKSEYERFNIVRMKMDPEEKFLSRHVAYIVLP